MSTRNLQSFHSSRGRLLTVNVAGGECGVPFYERFSQPYNTSNTWVDDQGKTRTPSWYSFDHGPIHFVGYTTELDFSPGSPQHL